MLTKDELISVIEIAKKYDIGELYLIGSTLHELPEVVNDYDFAVNDFPSGIFFKFYGELFGALSKNVDLIDVSGEKTKFKSLIIKEGKLIYARKAA